MTVVSIPSDAILAEAPKRLPKRDREIVVYCGNAVCQRSARAAERPARLGYGKVRDYHAGKAD